MNTEMTSASVKKGRKNGSSSLLKATQLLGDALTHLTSFPELRAETSTLRDKILTTLLEHARRTDAVS
jgi:hypothetical protein